VQLTSEPVVFRKSRLSIDAIYPEAVTTDIDFQQILCERRNSLRGSTECPQLVLVRAMFETLRGVQHGLWYSIRKAETIPRLKDLILAGDSFRMVSVTSRRVDRKLPHDQTPPIGGELAQDRARPRERFRPQFRVSAFALPQSAK